VKNPTDNATPSGNGIAAQVLVRLAAETAENGYRKRANELFAAFHTLMDLAPLRVESLLRAFDQAAHAGWGQTAAQKPAAAKPKVKRGRVVAELIPGQDKLLAGRPAPVAVRLTIDEGYHLQAAAGAAGVTHPTRVRVISKDLGRLQGLRYPSAEKLRFPEIGMVDVYEGEIVLPSWLEVPADAPRGAQVLRVEVSFQACRDGTCEAPQAITLSIPFEVVDGDSTVESLNAELFKDLAERP
jgi:hypothetical protein